MKTAVLIAALALAGCSLLHSPPVEAGTSTITWTNPTQNTDNTPIVDNGTDETSLASWRIEFGTCTAANVFGTKAGEIVRPRGAAALTSAVVNTASGLKCFRVLVTNLAGVESDASNVASRTVEAPKPKPATNTAAGS